MDLFAALSATWPAAEILRRDGWTLRRGGEGGNRVSAATRERDGADIAVAEAGMLAWGQRPLFMIRPGENDLDGELAAPGYRTRDATVLMADRARPLATNPGDAVVYCDAPLARMIEIWRPGGIGAERLAVMARAEGPKTWLLGRLGDRAAGCGFVACAGSVAMLHALEIAPAARRRGLGTRLSRAAAAWADRQGAETLALAVTRANAPALALYQALGLREVASYHYRVAPDGST